MQLLLNARYLWDSRDFEQRLLWVNLTRKNWLKASTLKGEKLKSDYSLLQSSSF